jgi:hypothetical protein
MTDFVPDPEQAVLLESFFGDLLAGGHSFQQSLAAMNELYPLVLAEESTCSPSFFS